MTAFSAGVEIVKNVLKTVRFAARFLLKKSFFLQKNCVKIIL